MARFVDIWWSVLFLFFQIYYNQNMKRKVDLLILLTFLIVFSACKPLFTVRNHRIYDSDGGERIFHGVNFGIKNNETYQSDFIYLKSQGINGLRVSLTWSDYEKEEGKYNQTYLQHFVNQVNRAGKYGIYSLIEFHQDIFSPKFCGDGVPVWAISDKAASSFPIPVKKNHTQFDPKTGRPIAGFCQNIQWSSLYAALAVNQAFSHLWSNKNGLLDKFAIYWKKVVQAFKGNPYVIAYELINQPWPGNMYKNPAVMIPGLSERMHLQHAYTKLSTQMRKVDPDINICFEPVTWLNEFPSGFTTAPGGHRYSNSSMFCFHYYYPPTLNLDGFMKARMNDIKKLNVGGILSQFFILQGLSKTSEDMMKKCDQLSISWFGWIYQRGVGSMIKGIQRIYSHRVAGSIIRQLYKPETNQYELYYTADRNAGTTVIYLGSTVDESISTRISLSPKVHYQIVDKHYLHIDSSKFEDRALVMITLTS